MTASADREHLARLRTAVKAVRAGMGDVEATELGQVLADELTALDAVLDRADAARPPAAASDGTGLRRVDHVGIAVADLDAAIAFYAKTFGLTCVHQEVNAAQGVREAMLAVGDGETRLQLLAPVSTDSTIARFLDRSGPGLQQLAYTVDDVAAVAAGLRAKGLRVLYDTARPGTDGSRVNFVHPRDAGGVLVELVEPAPQDRP